MGLWLLPNCGPLQTPDSIRRRILRKNHTIIPPAPVSAKCLKMVWMFMKHSLENFQMSEFPSFLVFSRQNSRPESRIPNSDQTLLSCEKQRMSFLSLPSTLWRGLPLYIQICSSIQTFTKLKTHFFSPSCTN